jgi:hypothetical protein
MEPNVSPTLMGWVTTQLSAVQKCGRFEKLVPIDLTSLRLASASSFQINYFQAGSFPRLVCGPTYVAGFSLLFKRQLFAEQLAPDPQVLNWRAMYRTQTGNVLMWCAGGKVCGNVPYCVAYGTQPLEAFTSIPV